MAIYSSPSSNTRVARRTCYSTGGHETAASPWPEKGKGMAWLAPPCSRNPHDEAVVVRRAQLGTKPGRPLKEGNEQAWGNEEGAARCPLCSQNAHDKKDRQGVPMLVLCSRNARPEKGLVRRPHLDQHGCPLPGEEKQASLEGSFRRMRVAQCAQRRIVWPFP